MLTMAEPQVVVVHTGAAAPCPFQVGDKVTYANSREVVWISRLWQEGFGRSNELQWVALLKGGRDDFTMRVAHLRKVDPIRGNASNE